MYKGICKNKGIKVEEVNSFYYAIERIIQGSNEEKQEFKEWFYSGNWIKENEGE